MTCPATHLTLASRRIIMAGWIFLFFLITPLVIFYTAGYRYDFASGQIKETGVLSIDVLPRDTKVFLNGVEIKKRQPIRLANRAPGTYHLRLEKNGYKPWEKDIAIESKKTTYLKQITLIREASPSPFILDDSFVNASAISLSNRGKYLLAAKTTQSVTEIYLIDTETKIKEILKREADMIPILLSSSPHYDLMAMAIEKNGFITISVVDKIQNSGGREETITSTRAFAYQWDERTPGLLFEKDKTIIRLSSRDRTFVANLPKDAAAWFVDNNGGIYTFHPERREFKRDGERVAGSPILITSIIHANHERIIAKHDAGILVIRLDGSERIVQLPATRSVENAGTEEWLGWSPTELWSIYQDGRTVLLNRRQEVIANVQPLDEFGVLLIATPELLYAFNPGYEVTQSLLRADNIRYSAVNKNSREIYFIGSIDGKDNLYALPF